MDLEKFGTAGDIQELLSIRDRIDRLLDESADVTTPRADLLDTGDAYQLVLEVPGVPQDNLEIALQGRTLTVAGLRENFDDGSRVVFSERPNGHFQRSVELPENIDRDATSAHLQGGLLIVTLPKN